MLLQQEVGDGVDVLSVHGPVAGPDARRLADAVDTALDRRPRGVVIDLRDVTSVEPEAVVVLRALLTRAPGALRPSLLLCSAPAEVEHALPDVDVPASRAEALARLDERAPTEPVEAGLPPVDHNATRSVVAIEHSPRGPAQARRVVAACAEQLGLVDAGDDLVLLVSEMVTNAVRHGAPPVVLELDYDDESVVVAVADGSARAPLPRTVDEDAEGGRGMTLVRLLAAEHGVRCDPPGKTVWAAVRRPR